MPVESVQTWSRHKRQTELKTGQGEALFIYLIVMYQDVRNCLTICQKGGKMEVREVQSPVTELRYARVRKAGNVIDLREYEKLNHQMNITRINEESYFVNSTGEVKDYSKMETRADNVQTVAKTMDTIGAIINANFNAGPDCAWMTLTYGGEPMRDSQKLYKDRKEFMKRIGRQFPKYKDNLEYMSVVEPQASGSFHTHELWKTKDGTRLFIPHKHLYRIWNDVVGSGGVNVQRLTKSDNIGAYLRAYLCNLPDESGGKTKAGQKGSRLPLYPAKMNIYRCSKGIIVPKWDRMIDKKTKEIIGSTSPNYLKVREVIDDLGNRVQTIRQTQYNTMRKQVKHDEN